MSRILYVEDENWQVETTVIKFIEKGLKHKVVLVNSLELAIDKLSNERFDVVFLDIMLNVSKGPIEFEDSALPIINFIKAGKFENVGNTYNLPIIIASGVWDMPIRNDNNSITTVEAKARELGIPQDYYLRKPFLDEELRSLLKIVLGN